MARLRTKQRRRPLARRTRRRKPKLGMAPRGEAGALPVFAHDVRTALTGVQAAGRAENALTK